MIDLNILFKLRLLFYIFVDQPAIQSVHFYSLENYHVWGHYYKRLVFIDSRIKKLNIFAIKNIHKIRVHF